MSTIGRSILAATIAFSLPSVLPAAPSIKVGDVLEEGFRVHTNTCLEFPPGLAMTVRDARCSPGGAWGSYVYVSLADIQIDERGQLARIDGNGKVDFFQTGYNPQDLAFSSGNGPFGDRLWVPLGFKEPFGMSGVDSTFSNHASTCAYTPHFVFDTSGAFGYALYTRGPAGIDRFTDPGNCSGIPLPLPEYEFFSAAPAQPLAFGPGGTWGTSIYASVGTIVAPDGSFTTFAFPFSEVTWATSSPGSPWAGDMFARLSGGDAGDVYRVSPDGTSTLFATGLPGELLFCSGSLWVVRNGACTRITATGPQ